MVRGRGGKGEGRGRKRVEVKGYSVTGLTEVNDVCVCALDSLTRTLQCSRHPRSFTQPFVRRGNRKRADEVPRL